jgi:hypothetical protein
MEKQLFFKKNETWMAIDSGFIVAGFTLFYSFLSYDITSLIVVALCAMGLVNYCYLFVTNKSITHLILGYCLGAALFFIIPYTSGYIFFTETNKPFALFLFFLMTAILMLFLSILRAVVIKRKD